MLVTPHAQEDVFECLNNWLCIVVCAEYLISSVVGREANISDRVYISGLSYNNVGCKETIPLHCSHQKCSRKYAQIAYVCPGTWWTWQTASIAVSNACNAAGKSTASRQHWVYWNARWISAWVSGGTINVSFFLVEPFVFTPEAIACDPCTQCWISSMAWIWKTQTSTWGNAARDLMFRYCQCTVCVSHTLFACIPLCLSLSIMKKAGAQRDATILRAAVLISSSWASVKWDGVWPNKFSS